MIQTCVKCNATLGDRDFSTCSDEMLCDRCKSGGDTTNTNQNVNTPQTKKLILLTVIALGLVVLNARFVLLQESGMSNIAEALGYITGRVLIFPLIIIGLFQIGKRFRTASACLKIFCALNLVTLVSNISNFHSVITASIN